MHLLADSDAVDEADVDDAHRDFGVDHLGERREDRLVQLVRPLVGIGGGSMPLSEAVFDVFMRSCEGGGAMDAGSPAKACRLCTMSASVYRSSTA